MLNRLVILVPLLALILSLIIAVDVIIQNEVIIQKLPIIRDYFTSNIIQNLPINLKTDPQTLHSRINQYRDNNHLPPLSNDPSICPQYSGQSTFSKNQDEIFSICQNCVKVSLVKISKFSTVEIIFAQLLNQSSIAEVISNPGITLLCIKEDPQYLTLLLAAQKDSPVSPAVKTPIAVVTIPPDPPKEFTEDELWSALILYRQAHKIADLQMSENLCQYARKRVNEHIDKYNSTTTEDYPVPDKYPLDAHTGFSRDADTGYVFEATNMNHVAENLAYWPNAQNAIHVIEWGWDSSTEGHRETQLSEDFSHACISGKEGFYVAIFGSN